MLNLLRKDFITLKSSLWQCVIYLVVFSVAFIPRMDISFHLIGIYTAFAIINLSTTIDLKNRNHHFLVTLPISRKHIVQAKYMAAVILTFLGVLASLSVHTLVSFLFPQLNKPELTLIDLFVPVLIVFVLISFYMPLFYSLSKKGSAAINGAFFIILIALAQPTAMFMNMMNERDSMLNQALWLIPIGILLLFIASYFITSKLFAKKDL